LREPDDVATFLADLPRAGSGDVLLMLFGGLRSGEVRSPRLSDVDRRSHRMRVTGNGGKERTAPVDQAFFAELADNMREGRPAGFFVGMLRSPTGPTTGTD
jgi:integrase